LGGRHRKWACGTPAGWPERSAGTGGLTETGRLLRQHVKDPFEEIDRYSAAAAGSLRPGSRGTLATGLNFPKAGSSASGSGRHSKLQEQDLVRMGIFLYSHKSVSGKTDPSSIKGMELRTGCWEELAEVADSGK